MEYLLVKSSQGQIRYLNKSSFSLSLLDIKQVNFRELIHEQAHQSLKIDAYILFIYNQGIEASFKDNILELIPQSSPFELAEEIMKKYSDEEQYSSIIVHRIVSPL